MNIFTPIKSNTCAGRRGNLSLCKGSNNYLGLSAATLNEQKELAMLFLDIRNFDVPAKPETALPDDLAYLLAVAG